MDPDLVRKLFHRCNFDSYIDIRIKLSIDDFSNRDEGKISYFWKVYSIVDDIVQIKIKKTNFSNVNNICCEIGTVIWNQKNREIKRVYGFRIGEVRRYFFSPCYKKNLSIDEIMMINFEYHKTRFIETFNYNEGFITKDVIDHHEHMETTVYFNKKPDNTIDIQISNPFVEPLERCYEISLEITSSNELIINKMISYNFPMIDVEQIIKSIFLEDYRIIVNCEREFRNSVETKNHALDIIKQDSLCPDVEKIILDYIC